MKGVSHGNYSANGIIASINWWDNSDNERRGYSVYDRELDFQGSESKTRHKFSPILLIYSTVYNCDYCGAKQEDCKTPYCDGSNDDEWEIGGW